jgi:hypothetical protein
VPARAQRIIKLLFQYLVIECATVVPIREELILAGVLRMAS